MKTFKRILILVLLLNLSTAVSCDTEEDICNECIAAQEHYIESLLQNGCSLLTTGPARQKVVDACENNGLAKATAIQTACATGDPQPEYNCD